MSGIDDDDPTPQPPAIDPSNGALFAALCDLRLALEHHSVRIGILAREVRLAASPVGPALRERVADELQSYADRATLVVADLRRNR